MWQRIKVFLLRWVYRYSSAKQWGGKYREQPHSILQLPTGDGPLEARMFNGSSGADKPLILYFHGGGWVIGDLDTHLPFCQVLSEKTGCTVITVNYRLAPEHPYPAAHNDALATARWTAQHIQQLGPSNGTLIVAGDSAGANLATCACLGLDAPTRKRVAGQVLIYPVTQHHKAYSHSFTEKGKGYVLTADLMIWFWDTYLGGKDETQAKGAMPMLARTVEHLPPTFLVTAEHDPLRDEGIAYAEKLRKAGVSTVARHFPNAQHGFVCSEGPTEDFDAFIEALNEWLGSRVTVWKPQ